MNQQEQFQAGKIRQTEDESCRETGEVNAIGCMLMMIVSIFCIIALISIIKTFSEIN